MTIVEFTNTGYHEKIKDYAKVIKQKLGKKLNYDKEGDYYYYVIYALDDLLGIIDCLDKEIIISKDIFEKTNYILEVYDDWRE